MAIEWERIGQPQFDRIIEALVHRLYEATAEVAHPVNGRGGDGGIDFNVRQGERLRIFQLKYYPDSLEGRGRRASIKKSFKRAMEHEPYEWVLVVPCTLTPGERTFVEGLAGDQEVKITVMDRAVLDDRLAAHSDIERSLARTRDDGGLLEYAKIMNRERDILAGGTDDLRTRVHDLGRVVDDLDPHWTLDFARQGAAVIQTLRGKHPRAQEVSPIAIRLKSRAQGIDADLAAAMERVLGFGAGEDLVLPPEAVERLTVEGPEWIAREYSNVGVIWRRGPQQITAGTEAEFAFLAEDAVTASYRGELTDFGEGTAGRTLALTIDGVNLQLMMPHSPGAPSTLNYSLEIAGKDTGTALRAISLHRRLLEDGRFHVSVAGHLVCIGNLTENTSDEALRDLADLRELVLDLEAVQRHCERYFPVPLEIPARERILLRLARRLVDGSSVINPFAKSLKCTLNGTGAPVLRGLLGSAGLFQATRPNCPVTIGGHTLDLGPVRIFHPRITVDDAAEALAALDTGDFAGLELTLRPADGQCYRVILDSALETIPPEQPVPPAPYALDGYPEPA
ncbi:hypothetical protein ACTMTU_34720 [Streptomyces sp. OZ13]|uniref:hypothetical protein n=1 Tax=Streptomyces sp. OZ13 TaxID=3452210 RepID=UPI003F89A7FE